MVAIAGKIPRKVAKKKIPDYLVKDEIDGIRFYYRNYKDILNKKENVEETMGCSAIQSLIIEYLLEVIYKSDLRKKYRVFTNEAGNHLALNNNLSFDIALYDREKLTAEAITKKYVQGIAPHTVIEVDTDISLDETGFATAEDYTFLKTRKLMQYGTQKVIWIFTNSQKIVVAEGKVWQIYDFTQTIQLFDNVEFNLDEFLKRENINL
jgi:hypothetical protein